jgi:CRP-like cAMP-binding protein
MNDDEERIELLQATPFFGATSLETIRFIIELAETQHKKPGEYFFHQSELGDSLYLLEQGEALVFKSWQGEEYPMRHVASGDCFGELALIDFTPRSASVRAETECTALKISSATLHRLYQENAEQFLIIQMNIAREVSRRLRAADDRWFQQQREKLHPNLPAAKSFHA